MKREDKKRQREEEDAEEEEEVYTDVVAVAAFPLSSPPRPLQFSSPLNVHARKQRLSPKLLLPSHEASTVPRIVYFEEAPPPPPY